MTLHEDVLLSLPLAAVLRAAAGTSDVLAADALDAVETAGVDPGTLTLADLLVVYTGGPGA